MEIESDNDKLQLINGSAKSTVLATITNILKSAVCSGLIMLPYNFYRGGYLAAII